MPDPDAELRRVSEAWEVLLADPEQLPSGAHRDPPPAGAGERRAQASERVEDAEANAEHEGLLFELDEDSERGSA
jgi:hypothetical protein